MDPETMDDSLKLFNHYKESNTPKIFQAFIRAKYQAFVRTNAITDHKAHILVSINSIFIGGIFILLQLNSELSRIDMFTIFVFLVSLILSLVFATLAVRPVYNRVRDKTDLSTRLGMSFRRMGQYGKRDFDRIFDETMQHQDMIYENIANDFYIFGVLLKAKYKTLNNAYNFFIGGLIITSILLLIDLAVARLLI